MYEFMDYQSNDGIATIALNRPDKRNAISFRMAAELRDCFKRFAASDDRVAVLVSNDERVFCAGADLFEPPENIWEAIPEIGFQTDKPIIAAANQKVIGIGVSLVSMCDFIVASEETVFNYPEAKLGFSNGLIIGAVKRMPARLAMEMIMLAEPISGQRAYDVGFANRLVAPGQEREEAMRMARILADNAPLVVQYSKRMCLDAMGKTPTEIQYQTRLQSDRMMFSEDADRGMEAWRSKTKPVFEGR